ncbi:MAG TPA: pyruvoyl-dependent arginine decarboxylase [Candidatus Bathyarchaeia archaeon]
MIPKYFFLTKGVGKHKEQLQPFQLALRHASIEHCNIVNMLSIILLGCNVLPFCRRNRRARFASC